MTEVIDYTSEKVLASLKDTVAKGATDSEFWWFLQNCKDSGLNPLKREIWCVVGGKYQDKAGNWVQRPAQIMVGINGFLAIANSHLEFDGMSTKLDFLDDGTVFSSTTTVYRKDRSHPHVVTVYWDEFYKPGVTYNGKYTPSTWDKMGKVMLQKCSKAHALREAFPQKLSGLYIPEEMETIIDTSEENESSNLNPSLPEPEKPKLQLFRYSLEDLAAKDPEKAEKAALWLKSKGISQEAETGHYINNQPIKQLKEYEVLV